MKTAKRPCSICDNTTVKFLHRQKFALPEGHPLAEGYEVVCCENCGFVYADTPVSQGAYDKFYAQYSKYEDKQTGTGGIENQWDHERVKVTARQIADYLGDSSAAVLDVGCANGGLLKALMDIGYQDVLGIDPSPVCVENTRQLGVDAKIGSLFQPLDHEPFDCVTLSHTLEHVQDLKQAARWISEVMKKNAVLYVEVPDASRYKDFVDAPFQDFNTEHINHFSITSLKNYLRVNGFDPVAWGEKVIPASANKPYPAIYCFAQKASQVEGIEKDEMLISNIEEYIERSLNILNEIETRLQTALSKNNRIIVWGTGQLAMKLLVETSLGKADIVAFVDSNPINQGKILRGIKVVSPEKIRNLSEPVLITSTLHQKSIAEQIDKMGLKNSLVFLKDE